jgi:hypothetical protein
VQGSLGIAPLLNGEKYEGREGWMEDGGRREEMESEKVEGLQYGRNVEGTQGRSEGEGVDTVQCSAVQCSAVQCSAVQ